MGTHLKVLSESYQMSKNMTGLRLFSKNVCVHVLWMKVASALEGLSSKSCGDVSLQMHACIIIVEMDNSLSVGSLL